MADIAITSSSVVVTSATQVDIGILGETVTAGLFVYLKASDGKWYKADALTEEKAGSGDIRMALSGGAIDQSVILLKPGQDITVGAVLTAGKPYVLSSTSVGGKMFLPNELVSTNYYTQLGYALTTSSLRFQPVATGIVLA